MRWGIVQKMAGEIRLDGMGVDENDVLVVRKKHVANFCFKRDDAELFAMLGRVRSGCEAWETIGRVRALIWG